MHASAALPSNMYAIVIELHGLGLKAGMGHDRPHHIRGSVYLIGSGHSHQGFPTSS